MVQSSVHPARWTQLAAALFLVALMLPYIHARSSVWARASFVSDETAFPRRFDDEWDEDDEMIDRRSRWPGNKIVVPTVDQSYVARPAAFGPSRVDEFGLWGTLQPIRAVLDADLAERTGNTGCLDMSATSMVKRRTKTAWIALIERGGCPFEVKVRAAQQLGAVAAVVGDERPRSSDADSSYGLLSTVGLQPWDDEYDTPNGQPITMFPDGDASDIRIPSCFVIRSTYDELLDYTDKAAQGRLREKELRVGLFLDKSRWDEPWVDMGLLFFLLPSICIFGIVVWQHVRQWWQRLRERASLDMVRQLPCYEWHPDGQWKQLEADAVPTRDAASWIGRALQPFDRLWVRVQSCLVARPRTPVPVVLSGEEAPLLQGDDSARRPWYVQDECPICLVPFAEAYVYVLTQ